MSYEAIYGGAVYPLADAAAASALEDAVSRVFSDGGRGGFVGFVSQNSTVRLLITSATPLAIRGSNEPNPSLIRSW